MDRHTDAKQNLYIGPCGKLDLNFQHHRVNDICILKNSELLGRLHSLECGIGSRHGNIFKLYIRGLYGQSVHVLVVGLVQLSQV